MSEQRELLYLAAILFVFGVAFLLVPQYANYCSQNDTTEKYCASSEVVSLLASFLDVHNGTVTATATIFIGPEGVNEGHCLKKVGVLDAAQDLFMGHRQLHAIHLPLCAATPVVAEAEVLGSVGRREQRRFPFR
jgi:hypothetical protein